MHSQLKMFFIELWTFFVENVRSMFFIKPKHSLTIEHILSNFIGTWSLLIFCLWVFKTFYRFVGFLAKSSGSLRTVFLFSIFNDRGKTAYILLSPDPIYMGYNECLRCLKTFTLSLYVCWVTQYYVNQDS